MIFIVFSSALTNNFDCCTFVQRRSLFAKNILIYLVLRPTGRIIYALEKIFHNASRKSEALNFFRGIFEKIPHTPKTFYLRKCNFRKNNFIAVGRGFNSRRFHGTWGKLGFLKRTVEDACPYRFYARFSCKLTSFLAVCLVC